jgi:hypothetical protein
MRVLLLHLDGKLPNIALMRIAAHHRALGHEVSFRRTPTPAAVEPELGDDFDRVYASAIFDRTRPVAERLLAVRPDAIIGGTGWDVWRTLEQVGVTTQTQDYSLYPRFSSSIGFSQRGCRLKCDFCVVPRKEGGVRDAQPIHAIWRGEGHPRQILLLDNDFFGAPGWRERVAELREGGFRVCFSQGINARMLSEAAAAAIASLDYREDSFARKRIYTAWDSREDEGTLFRGLDRLRAAGVAPDHVMVYMLIGYWAGETHADRDYRRARLRAWGARPYPMPFTRTKELLGFARWVIGAYDKSIPWEEWTRARYQPCGLGDRSGAQRHLPLLGFEPDDSTSG